MSLSEKEKRDVVGRIAKLKKKKRERNLKQTIPKYLAETQQRENFKLRSAVIQAKKVDGDS